VKTKSAAKVTKKTKRKWCSIVSREKIV